MVAVPVPVPEAVTVPRTPKEPVILRLTTATTVTGHGQRTCPRAAFPPVSEPEHKAAHRRHAR